MLAPVEVAASRVEAFAAAAGDGHFASSASTSGGRALGRAGRACAGFDAVEVLVPLTRRGQLVAGCAGHQGCLPDTDWRACVLMAVLPETREPLLAAMYTGGGVARSVEPRRMRREPAREVESMVVVDEGATA